MCCACANICNSKHTSNAQIFPRTAGSAERCQVAGDPEMSQRDKTGSDLCTDTFSWPWQNYHNKHDATSAAPTQRPSCVRHPVLKHCLWWVKTHLSKSFLSYLSSFTIQYRALAPANLVFFFSSLFGLRRGFALPAPWGLAEILGTLAPPVLGAEALQRVVVVAPRRIHLPPNSPLELSPPKG